MSATIEELLLSAEYILAGGNYDLMLCERGIRTFETYTRNTMDISAIPVIHKLSHLPILATLRMESDAATLSRRWPKAALAAGADGLAYGDASQPRQAISDGAQSLFPDQFEKLVEELRIIAPAVGRKIAAPVSVAEQVSV